MDRDGQTSARTEIVVAEKKIKVEYDWEHQWMGSKKTIRLGQEYLVKAGFDLEKPFWIEMEKGIRPRDIVTRKAMENAITVITALGGSTNAVLHFLAIAHTAGIRLEIEDFNRIGKRVPVLADLKPSGRFVMAELVKIGGLVPLMKRLLEKGMLHGDCLTVTGKTMEENLRNAGDYPTGQEIVRPFSDPIKKTGHLVVLRGNWRQVGRWRRSAGRKGSASRVQPRSTGRRRRR